MECEFLALQPAFPLPLVNICRFQWVNLRLIYLTGMRFEDDILENLGRLPKSLSAAYSQILTTMREESTDREWHVTKKALMWIMCSRELLTEELWTEISFWPMSVPTGGSHILFELCRNLVALDSESMVVRLSHLSVHEYLETTFGPIRTNTMAAENCLSSFDPSHSSPSAQFLQYSASYCVDHMERSYIVGESIDNTLLRRWQLFMGTLSAPGQGYTVWLSYITRRSWRGSYNLREMISHLHSIPPNPLFPICYFPFGVTLQQLLKSAFDSNVYNETGVTPIFVASVYGNTWAVERLLEKGADPNVGSCHPDRCSPLVAAVGAGNFGIALLLAPFVCGVDTFRNALQIAAWRGTPTLFEGLLQSYPLSTITESILIGVTGNSVYSQKLIEILFERGIPILITEAVVAAAARNEICGDRAMKAMLAVDRHFSITDSAVIKLWEISDIDTIKMLISRGPDIDITGTILTAAAANWRFGSQAVALALEIKPDIPISEAVVLAATRNQKCGIEVMAALFATNREFEMTEAALAAWESDQVLGETFLKIMLGLCPTIKATEAVLVTAANGGKYGLKIITLMASIYPNLQVTEATILAAVSNRCYGERAMQILQAVDPGIIITERALIRAAGNGWCGDRILENLLARSPNTAITEQVILNEVGNDLGGDRTLAVLLAHNPDAVITEETLIRAAKNRLCGHEMIALLLNRNSDLEITQPVLVEVVGNQFCGHKILRIVLGHDPDIAITQDVMTAIARNAWCGRQILSLIEAARASTEARWAHRVELLFPL